VHELAKELGLSNKDTLDLAVNLGIGVKSHSSSIEHLQADRVRRKAEREGLVADRQSAPVADPRRPSPPALRAVASPVQAPARAPAPAPAPAPALAPAPPPQPSVPVPPRIGGAERVEGTASVLVVDGSNAATPAGSNQTPSLARLDAALTCLARAFPHAQIVTIVDATFEHRIPPGERGTFERRRDSGELHVTPAGTVGRGDALILKTANALGAAVVSNDSFAELQAEHPWLRDAGRLFGHSTIAGVTTFLERRPVMPRSDRAPRPPKGSARA
jgi:hypothetical protein